MAQSAGRVRGRGDAAVDDLVANDVAALPNRGLEPHPSFAAPIVRHLHRERHRAHALEQRREIRIGGQCIIAVVAARCRYAGRTPARARDVRERAAHRQAQGIVERRRLHRHARDALGGFDQVLLRLGGEAAVGAATAAAIDRVRLIPDPKPQAPRPAIDGRAARARHLPKDAGLVERGRLHRTLDATRERTDPALARDRCIAHERRHGPGGVGRRESRGRQILGPRRVLLRRAIHAAGTALPEVRDRQLVALAATTADPRQDLLRGGQDRAADIRDDLAGVDEQQVRATALVDAVAGTELTRRHFLERGHRTGRAPAQVSALLPGAGRALHETVVAHAGERPGELERRLDLLIEIPIELDRDTGDVGGAGRSHRHAQVLLRGLAGETRLERLAAHRAHRCIGRQRRGAMLGQARFGAEDLLHGFGGRAGAWSLLRLHRGGGRPQQAHPQPAQPDAGGPGHSIYRTTSRVKPRDGRSRHGGFAAARYTGRYAATSAATSASMAAAAEPCCTSACLKRATSCPVVVFHQ